MDDLKVVVSAGAGHQAEFAISRDKLAAIQSDVSLTPKTKSLSSDQATPLIDHTYQIPYKEILAGFGFLLGLAAFVLSLRNMRQLRELKQSLTFPPGKHPPAALPTDRGRR